MNDRNRPTATAVIAILVQYLLTLVHHLYGGLVFGTPERLVIAAVVTAILVVTLGLLYLYRRTGSATALVFSLSLIVLFWVVLLGGYEGGYNHVYQTVRFLAGVDVPNYPRDAFFQVTGILTFVAAYFPARAAWCLAADRWASPASPAIRGG